MFDLIVRNGVVVDPLNGIEGKFDVAIENGSVVEVAETISGKAKVEKDALGKYVLPGIIDMHLHLRTVLGHPHAQRMATISGVCTALDMAGPLDNILDSIPGSGSGMNIAILETANYPDTLPSERASSEQIRALIDKSLAHGALGLKLLGGDFPMDLDISADIVRQCSEKNAWVAWHAGTKQHGSNIEGVREAVAAAEGRFLHLAHINSYCRGRVNNELDEALEAIELLKANPNIFSESYLSALNGTRLGVANGKVKSGVTRSCLRKFGYSDTAEDVRAAILNGKLEILYDNGQIGYLISGEQGALHWDQHMEDATGCFKVNPAVSRFLLAQAKRKDGSFVVDSFSTDGGTYPRNVIVEAGLLLVKFNALTMQEFVLKSSLNGARALGIPTKGHLGVGADGDITIVDYEAGKATSTIVAGNIIMDQGQLCGSGSTVICDARGADYLKSRSIKYKCVEPLSLARIENRFVIK